MLFLGFYNGRSPAQVECSTSPYVAVGLAASELIRENFLRQLQRIQFLAPIFKNVHAHILGTDWSLLAHMNSEQKIFFHIFLIDEIGQHFLLA